MAFQFQCPQCANVLQAEESQAGGQSQCPICQTAFIIPAPVVPAPGPAAPFSPPPDTAHQPSGGPQTPFPGVGEASPTGPAEPETPFPKFGDSDTNAGEGPATTGESPALEKKEPELLHIPCPECKEVLETPVEMLDQDVMCPHCEAQFRLHQTSSLEHKSKIEQQRKMREQKADRAWLYWAIAVVVLVVIFLLCLILSSGGE